MKEGLCSSRAAELVDAATGQVVRGRAAIRERTAEFDATGLGVRDTNYVGARSLLVQLGFA